LRAPTSEKPSIKKMNAITQILKLVGVRLQVGADFDEQEVGYL